MFRKVVYREWNRSKETSGALYSIIGQRKHKKESQLSELNACDDKAKTAAKRGTKFACKGDFDKKLKELLSEMMEINCKDSESEHTM